MPEVITFDKALEKIGAERCSVLLGNGFSATYCGYRTLLEKSGLAEDAPSRQLFDRLDTPNFERVVRALEDAAEVADVYENAYFSRLEHQLLLLRALQGKPMAEGELKQFVGDLWDEKLRKMIDVTEPKAQKIYAELKGVKERVRNPFSHGGMENDGGSLFVHVPSVGALPANFTGIKNSVRFNFYPMEKEDHGETCFLFDAVDELLRTGPLAAAYELMDAGIDPSFDQASIARFGAVSAGTPQERSDFIHRWQYEQDRHDNMDY